MAKITLVTDRGCDLPEALLHMHDIHLVPLLVRFGSEVILDDSHLAADAFWARVQTSAFHPETSQPSVGMFEAAFGPLVQCGCHVVCPVLSGRLSGTFNAAFAAAQTFPGQVTIFDTLSLSLGEGYQVLVAAEAAAAGRSLAEILAVLESTRARTHFFFALDTVEYLRRGGRAARLMPVLQRLARMLSIKPILGVVEGELQVIGTARSFEGAKRRIKQEIARYAPAEMLMVAHTRRSQEAQEFARVLAQDLDFAADKVLVAEAGSALGAHAGPGVIAAAITERER